MARKHDLNRYGGTYTRANVDWYRCIYCGEEGGITDDHVPPISKAYLVDENHREIYPACSRCNSILKDKGIYLDDRAIVLYYLLEKKNKKWLKIPDWTDEELEEMEYGMVKHIKQGLARKKKAKRQLEYIKLIYKVI